MARHKVLTAIGGLAVIGVLGQAFGGNSSTPVASPPAASSSVAPAPVSTPVRSSEPVAPAPTTEAPVPEPTQTDTPQEASGEYGSQPSDQKDFVAAVVKSQKSADEADNDMKLGSALSGRNKTLCKIIDNGKIKNWSGKISSLDANGEGKGVVSIEIGDDIEVSTWNNAFSDYEDDTLIPPGSLFDKFLSFNEDDVVTFSGRLVRGDSCVNDSRLTLNGKLTDPKFIFKFSAVK